MSGHLVTVGRILKPFGIAGEVVILSMGDDPERFARGSSFYLDQEKKRCVTVASLRAGGGVLRVRFEGYADRTAVGELVGSVLYQDEDALPELPDGLYYHFQLVGMKVTKANGDLLGKVVRVLDLPGGDVYEVEGSTEEWTVPARPEYVAWKDLEKGEIRLQDRDDLLEAVAKPKKTVKARPRDRKRMLRRRDHGSTQ